MMAGDYCIVTALRNKNNKFGGPRARASKERAPSVKNTTSNYFYLFIIFSLLKKANCNGYLLLLHPIPPPLPAGRAVYLESGAAVRRGGAPGARGRGVAAGPARAGADADGIEIYRLPSWPVDGRAVPRVKAPCRCRRPLGTGHRLCGYPDGCTPKASGQPASASGGASRRWSSTTPPAI